MQHEHREFSRIYELGEVLGSGGFAEVRRATDKRNGREVAVKVVSVPRGSKHSLLVKSMIMHEINILRRISHASVVKLLAAYTHGRFWYLVMELASGGELLSELLERTYTEAEARAVMGGLCRGVMYLHGQCGVVHRDLKLENILLCRKGDRTTVKIADFGLAGDLVDGPLRSLSGSTLYVAPEVLCCRKDPNATYNHKCDIWSLGVALYILLAGHAPFEDDDADVLMERISSGRFTFPDASFAGVSSDAKDLISRMLTKDPRMRITLPEVMAHRWMNPTSPPALRPPRPQRVHSYGSGTSGGLLRSAVLRAAERVSPESDGLGGGPGHRRVNSWNGPGDTAKPSRLRPDANEATQPAHERIAVSPPPWTDGHLRGGVGMQLQIPMRGGRGAGRGHGTEPEPPRRQPRIRKSEGVAADILGLQPMAGGNDQGDRDRARRASDSNVDVDCSSGSECGSSSRGLLATGGDREMYGPPAPPAMATAAAMVVDCSTQDAEDRVDADGDMDMAAAPRTPGKDAEGPRWGGGARGSACRAAAGSPRPPLPPGHNQQKRNARDGFRPWQMVLVEALGI